MSLAHAARAYRLREKQKQARARGAGERALLYEALHKAHLAVGMADFHAEMGSPETATELYRHAYNLCVAARIRFRTKSKDSL